MGLSRRHSALKLTWQVPHEKRQWSNMKSDCGTRRHTRMYIYAYVSVLIGLEHGGRHE